MSGFYWREEKKHAAIRTYSRLIRNFIGDSKSTSPSAAETRFWFVWIDSENIYQIRVDVIIFIDGVSRSPANEYNLHRRILLRPSVCQTMNVFCCYRRMQSCQQPPTIKNKNKKQFQTIIILLNCCNTQLMEISSEKSMLMGIQSLFVEYTDFVLTKSRRFDLFYRYEIGCMVDKCEAAFIRYLFVWRHRSRKLLSLHNHTSVDSDAKSSDLTHRSRGIYIELFYKSHTNSLSLFSCLRGRLFFPSLEYLFTQVHLFSVIVIIVITNEYWIKLHRHMNTMINNFDLIENLLYLGC